MPGRFEHPGRLRDGVARLAVLASSVLSLACEPKVGDSCDPGEARCLDGKTQLICSEGRYMVSPCMGPAGCAQVEQTVKCDFSKNEAGSPCSRRDEGAAACVDPERLVSCREGEYRITPCRGPGGCQTVGDQAECDRSIATPGEPCTGDLKACDKAGTQVLTCQGGKLQPSYYCRGPNGCDVKGQVECDLSVAREGDPCDSKLEAAGAVACGVDARQVLSCKDTKFLLKETCAGTKRCDPDRGMRCAEP